MRDSFAPLEVLVEEIRETIASKKNLDRVYIGLEQIEPGSLRVASPARADTSTSTNFMFGPGDILFGKLRPNLKKVAQAGTYGYCSTDILVLRARHGIDQRFAAWTMQSPSLLHRAIASAEGTRMPRTSWAELKNYQVFLPDIVEQRRISEILDTLDDRIQAVQSLTRKLEHLKRGLLADRLGAISLGFPSPDWRRVPLGEVVPSIDYGISHPLTDQPDGVPVLRMNNVGETKAGYGEVKYSSSDVPANLLLRPGDVLFNRTNSIDHVGRSGMWRGEFSKATFASYLVRLNVDRTQLLPEYLALWLSYPTIRQRVKAIATPAVQQVNVNPTKLRTLPIDFPSSIDEQRKIIDSVGMADVRITHENAELRKLRMLKEGLMDDLLSGRVRVTRGGTHRVIRT